MVGIVTPAGQLGQGVEVAGALRQSLLSNLGAARVEAVPLESREPAQLDAEARARGCAYVLYTQVELRHRESLGGFMRKLAPIASALPGVAGLGGMGGGGNGALISAVAQSAASASAAAAQQQAVAQMSGAQQSAVKSGDAITLEYRLVAPGETAPLRTEKLKGQAKADGEDVLGPLVAQLSTAVVSAATGQPPAATADNRAGGDAQASRADKGGERSQGGGGAGFFGGLFGGSKRNAPIPTNEAQDGLPPGMDCNRIAQMPGSSMSVESCQKMMESKRAYDAALSDPRASRPGDEKMSCTAILAELKQQQYTAPDQAKVAEGQTSSAAFQAKMAEQRAEMTTIAVKQQAKVNAAVAHDTTVEMATHGLVKSQTASALEMKQLDDNVATGERMAKERAPHEKRLINSAADIAADAPQQLANNPRLARLIQLSSARNCKGE